MSLADDRSDTVRALQGQPDQTADQTIIDDAAYDAEEERHAHALRLEAVGKRALPTLVVLLTLYGRDRVVAINNIPHYILPSPQLVAVTLLKD